MSQNPSPHPNPGNQTWGLGVPGRPNTPSEGFAMAYQRVGPAITQKTRKFDNGTCLTFGPNDPVDEFDADAEHPFMNQVALVDKAIRDIKVTRQRYEGETRVQIRIPKDEDGGESVGSGETAQPDPFDDFRTQTLDPATLSKVTLESGTYVQVPSRFASVSTLVSVYSVSNKSDVPGTSHMGSSVDTRFGNPRVTNESSTLQQHLKRENTRFRLRRYHEQIEMEEIRRNYVQRSGRQTHSTTGLRRVNHRFPAHRQRNANQQREQVVEGNAKHQHTNAGQHRVQEEQNIEQGTRPQRVHMDGNRPRTVHDIVMMDLPTHPSSVTLVGSSSFSRSGKMEGFPPDFPKDIHRPLHPGQQYANRLAEHQRQRQLALNARAFGQVDNADELALDQAPGALAARAARIVPRPTSVPGTLIENYRRIEYRNPPPGVFHNGKFISEDSVRGEMLLQNGYLRLPEIGQMLGQGMGAEDVIREGNIAGIHHFGFRGPMMPTQMGDPLLFPAPGPHMLARAGTLTHSPLRSSHSLQDLVRAMGDTGINDEDPFANQGMRAPHGMLGAPIEMRKKTRRGHRSNRALAQRADGEYARFMDELNEESRERGDKLLAGDLMSGHGQAQVSFNIQPPSPLPKTSRNGGDKVEDDDMSTTVEPEEQEAWSNLMTSPDRKVPGYHLSPAVFDATTSSFIVPPKRGPHLLAASRPPTQSPRIPIFQEGRNSAPLRSRPALLSPLDALQHRDSTATPLDIAAVRQQLTAKSNLIFGEKPGSVTSHNPSPAGILRRSASGRRLYEK